MTSTQKLLAQIEQLRGENEALTLELAKQGGKFPPRIDRTMQERVRMAYRHLHPHKNDERGYLAWFRRELVKRGDVRVSPATVRRWLLEDSVPVSQIVAVDDVARQLEVEAVHRLRKAIKEVTG